MPDETPLEQLGAVVGDLRQEALRADATGREEIVVSHAWAERLMSTYGLLLKAQKPDLRRQWDEMNLAARVLLVGMSAALSLVTVSLGWFLSVQVFELAAGY